MRSKQNVIDRKFMKMALAMAARGGRKVAPNPLVGCVIVNSGRIVGKGFHEYFGGNHAEVNALHAAGDRARGSTLYVTLEPCDHHGKTPPCTQAILRSGVSRVVVAMRDPNPRVNGKGLSTLRRNGIDVSEGVMAWNVRKFNSAYVKREHEKKSAVIVKFAMSVDGKIATRTGDSRWISSRPARAFVHILRSNVDAVIVGATTAIRDNPRLTSHGGARNPVRVIIDPQLRTPVSAHVFDGEAPTIVFHSAHRSSKKLMALQNLRIVAVQLPREGDRMDFRAIIARLRAFSLNRILIEGGGETIASALESNVVTDLVGMIAPKIIGGRKSTTPVGGDGVARVREAIKLHGIQLKRIGNDFCLSARIGQARHRR